MSYKKVIDKSIKFLRLLNTFIVDLGTPKNIIDRKVYRGIPAQLFSNVKEGEVFRVVNWS